MRQGTTYLRNTWQDRPLLMGGITDLFKGATGASALQLSGDLVSSAYQAKENRQARRDQRAFSAKAHQVEVADLRAAGLNPILSATGGRVLNLLVLVHLLPISVHLLLELKVNALNETMLMLTLI